MLSDPLAAISVIVINQMETNAKAITSKKRMKNGTLRDNHDEVTVALTLRKVATVMN